MVDNALLIPSKRLSLLLTSRRHLTVFGMKASLMTKLTSFGIHGVLWLDLIISIWQRAVRCTWWSHIFTKAYICWCPLGNHTWPCALLDLHRWSGVSLSTMTDIFSLITQRFTLSSRTHVTELPVLKASKAIGIKHILGQQASSEKNHQQEANPESLFFMNNELSPTNNITLLGISIANTLS